MSGRTSKRRPPRREKGAHKGPRPFNGELLDVAAVAKYLGSTEKTVRGMIARRVLPFAPVGGRRLVRRRELERWLDGIPQVTADEALRNLAAQQGEEV